MRLTLTVLAHPDNAAQRGFTRSFSSFPIAVGRSAADCDYVLGDPDRYVSRRHALITREGGTLILEDSSLSGVYVNSADKPLGRGNRVELHDRDTLGIGNYSIAVAIDHNDASIDPLDAGSDTIDPFGGEDPFADLSPATGDDMGDSIVDAPPPPGADDNYGWLPDEPSDHAAPGSGDHDGSTVRTPRSESPPTGAASLVTLCRAAGIDPIVLDDKRAARAAGRLLRESVEGLMALLRSRGEIKGAMRADVTLLSASNNNPLKVCPDGADALARLLLPQERSGGYLDGEKAIGEAIDDLKLHQLAMLDGMKAAVRSLLERFDPERLGEELEERHPLVANIPLTREAQLWKLFERHHEEIREALLDDFSTLFGREFRRAYERRVSASGRGPDFQVVE